MNLFFHVKHDFLKQVFPVLIKVKNLLLMYVSHRSVIQKYVSENILISYFQNSAIYAHANLHIRTQNIISCTFFITKYRNKTFFDSKHLVYLVVSRREINFHHQKNIHKYYNIQRPTDSWILLCQNIIQDSDLHKFKFFGPVPTHSWDV